MNANPCSATIWPEMGESAALTTGLEAESISAHFLDHLVPHPKRGKCGLYHAPTLSFCHSTPGSKLGTRGRADCAGSQPGPRAELPGRVGDPRLHLHPPAIALMGRERPWRGERVHPPASLSSSLRPPRPLPFRGAWGSGAQSRGAPSPPPAAVPGEKRGLPLSAHKALPGRPGGARPQPRAPRAATGPASAQRDLHGCPGGRRLGGGWEMFLLCGFTGRGCNEPPRICI